MEERIWFNLPLKDFMSSMAYALAKANIGILGIIQDFNYEKTFPRVSCLSEDEIKKLFVLRVQSFLDRNNVNIQISDAVSIWSCYTVWIELESNTVENVVKEESYEKTMG